MVCGGQFGQVPCGIPHTWLRYIMTQAARISYCRQFRHKTMLLCPNYFSSAIPKLQYWRLRYARQLVKLFLDICCERSVFYAHYFLLLSQLSQPYNMSCVLYINSFASVPRIPIIDFLLVPFGHFLLISVISYNITHVFIGVSQNYVKSYFGTNRYKDNRIHPYFSFRSMKVSSFIKHLGLTLYAMSVYISLMILSILSDIL